jgi:hypothetical protein
MTRPFAAALFAVVFAAPAFAADPAPETLLSPSTQLYVRWDGVAAHADAYKMSIWGPVMAGPTGDSIRAIEAMVPKLLGNTLLAEPLLDGEPPAELKAKLADLKQASKLIELITDAGVVVGAEIREPRPTLRGAASAIGGLIGGKPPNPESLLPDVIVLVVVPDVGPRAESLFAAVRLATKQAEVQIEAFEAHGRKGFRYVPEKNGDGGPPVQVHAAWWAEGGHFVFYVGTMKPDAAVAEVAANPKKGGVTGHPLFQRVRKNPGFESVARGFADAGRVVPLAKAMAGPFVPGLSQRIDDVGLGNLKAITFNSGFDGRESRAVWEVDLPGERKGLAKVLKNRPLGLNDLPPLPPDVSRFAALRVDPAAVYEAGINLVEALTYQEQFGVEDRARKPADAIRLRREYLAKELDKAIGVGVTDDLLPCLGDKVVMFQSPTEGLSVFGTVVCVSLNDPERARAVADRVHNAVETLVSAPIKVRKKSLKGVEIRELYSRGFGFVIPTYAVVGDWLVIGLHPQVVQGFVLRAKGELPSWKPDAATAARLAKLPAGAGCNTATRGPPSRTCAASARCSRASSPSRRRSAGGTRPTSTRSTSG